MELLETTPIPWAQGVGRSNRPAPTNLFLLFVPLSLDCAISGRFCAPHPLIFTGDGPAPLTRFAIIGIGNSVNPNIYFGGKQPGSAEHNGPIVSGVLPTMEVHARNGAKHSCSSNVADPTVDAAA